MFVHSRAAALMLFGLALLNSAPEVKAAIVWTGVTPGNNYIVLGSLMVGGYVDWTGATPAVTQVKVTLTENATGTKWLLNKDAALMTRPMGIPGWDYRLSTSLPNPGTYTLEVKAYNTDGDGTVTELGSPPNYPLTLTKLP